ncbi:hypothetical protein LP417_27695 [Polaromonas sp. P1-6]|nr:hypothetical protein LP417_27695 [Polaromonas sp. P1-6]
MMVPLTFDKSLAVASSWGASSTMRSGVILMLGPAMLDATTNLCIVEAIRRAVAQGTTQAIEPLVA